MLSYYTATSGLAPTDPSYHKKPLLDRFWAKVSKSDEPDGCWLWTGGQKGRRGDQPSYGAFGIYYKTVGAHCFSWELHNGPIPEGLWVLHKCDVKPCVRPDHLFLGTNQDNCLDAVRKGLWGDHTRRSRGKKLQLWEVLVMKEQLSIGIFKDEEVAAWWGLNRTTVSAVRRGKTWKRVHTDTLPQ